MPATVAPADSPPLSMTAPAADLSTWLTGALLLIAVAYFLGAPLLGVWYSSLGAFDLQRQSQVLLLCAVAILALVHALVRSPLPRLPAAAVIGLTVVLGLGLLSSLVAARPLHGLREVALFAGLFLLALGIADARVRFGAALDRAALSLIWVLGLLYLVLFLGVHLAGHVDTTVGVYKFFPSFVSPRYFSHLISWLLPIMCVPAVPSEVRNGYRTLIMWVVASGWWMLLLATGSRGGIVALALAAVAVALVFGRAALPWLRGHLVAAAVGIAGHELFSRVVDFSLASTMVQRGASDNGRFDLWRHAISMAESAPWLGQGPGHFAYYRDYFAAETLHPHNPAAHPHNALLQWLSEWGVPATLILAMLVLWGLSRWLRFARSEARSGADRPHRLLLIGVTGSLLAAGAHSFVCGIIVMPVSQTFGAMIVGWAIGIYITSRSAGGAVAVRSPRAHLLLAGLAAATVVALASTREIAAAPYDGAAIWPRYWLDGGIP